ncbi:uncharacterized protein LOC132543262 [Ylistrum balloti]|uniref:uncharacterized protein LOC132543262 n=1 Tax=Ylistrum balloti TaxID=509963 RepID=UPI002905C54E|nr:uncharacterized protein LOC132543262 [Ylistrum balloti]
MEGIEENILDKLSMPHLLQIRFPLKLWQLLNSCDSGAISWSIDGNSFIINRRIFQTEFLSRKRNTFKTQNINSLVRQLNLYGFQKVQRRPFAGISRKHWPDLLEYRHNFFRKGHPELLNNVQRRSKDDDEDQIASSNLSRYQTQESLSNTKCSQNQDEIYVSASKEEEQFGTQATAFCTQGNTQCQPMKLPLKRVKKLYPRNILQTLPLQSQTGVFQFPITVPNDSSQSFPIPLKICSTQKVALSQNLDVAKQDTNFQVMTNVDGKLYVQGNLVQPVASPLTIQVLANGSQTLQTAPLQVNGVQHLQIAAFRKTGVQYPQTASLTEPGVQNFQTDPLQDPGVQTFHLTALQYPGVQTIQTASLQDPGVQTIQTASLQDPGVQTIQTASLQDPGVQTIQTASSQDPGVQTIQTTSLQDPGVQTIQTASLQDPGVQTIQTASLQDPGVQTIQTTPLQEPSVEIIQTAPLQETGVQTIQTAPLQELGIQTIQTSPSKEPAFQSIQTAPLQEPGVLNLQGETIQTLQWERISGQNLYILKSDNSHDIQNMKLDYLKGHNIQNFQEESSQGNDVPTVQTENQNFQTANVNRQDVLLMEHFQHENSTICYPESDISPEVRTGDETVIIPVSD